MATTPTGGTDNLADIPPTTFHSFPKLSPEIRVKIWKYACFPRSETDHGIHYVTVNIVHEDFEEEDIVTIDDNLEGYDEEFAVESDDDGYITLMAPKLPFDHAAGLSSNASACLWDARLSTACHESMLALAEYHNLQGWREL